MIRKRTSKSSSVPVISVVIPAYNEEGSIHACLTALTNQRINAPYEIIVVNNNSTDRTVKIAKQFPVIVVQEKNKGYGEAARTGVRRAKASIVAMTDADTIVNPLWLSRIVSAFQKNPSTVALGGPFEYHDGSLAFRKTIRLANRIYPKLLSPALCGMNMAFRIDAYTAVGGHVAGVNLQADSHLGRRLMKHGRVDFLSKNLVVSTSRRFNHSLSHSFKEFSIRAINHVATHLFGKQVFFTQTDIR